MEVYSKLTLQVEFPELLERPDLLVDREELVVAQREDRQLLQSADGGGHAAQVVVRQVQRLGKGVGFGNIAKVFDLSYLS